MVPDTSGKVAAQSSSERSTYEKNLGAPLTMQSRRYRQDGTVDSMASGGFAVALGVPGRPLPGLHIDRELDGWRRIIRSESPPFVLPDQAG
jgi:hypothetical protein